MSDTVIKVENLSKQYRLGKVGTGSLAHDLNRTWHRVRGKEDPYLKIGEANDRSVKGNSEYVWALQDINFEVKQGEVLGIIGRNGAGKSTLLKILSRTTIPTTGSIKIKGRIASLLEVGTGFHPELSGRENIFLNGAILGMTRQEIKRKFDEIVDFAGVERYIDTPVKRYSSGMYVRLAFGVAAHLEPEILIVDEVLAVGDAEFQKKALGKMKDVSDKDGRTVLFVSHNMGAMRRLCSQCIYLKDGQLFGEGDIASMVDLYIKHSSNASGQRKITFPKVNNSVISIKSLEINVEGKNEDTVIEITDTIKVNMCYEVEMDCIGTNIAFSLNKDGILVLRTWDIDLDSKLFELRKKGEYRVEFILPNFLTAGNYSISVASGKSNVGAFESHEDCISFEIENNSRDLSHNSSSRGGILTTNIEWKII